MDSLNDAYKPPYKYLLFYKKLRYFSQAFLLSYNNHFPNSREKLFTLYWYKIIKFSEIFGRQLAFYIAV